MLSKSELHQTAQLITEADRAISELGDVLEATRAQIDASREVTGLVPKSKFLVGEVLRAPVSAASEDAGQN